MTDPNYTALLLIIDRSGSMMDIRADMVGGLTKMLADQATEPGLLTVDVVTFDNRVEYQCSLATPAGLTIALEPRGGTALYDAIGIAVNTFGATLAALPEHARPGAVQVVIVTDGMENSSHEYTRGAVRKLIQRQVKDYNWDFVFLGANQDAVLAGADLGIDPARALTFAPEADKIASMTGTLSRYVTNGRTRKSRGFTNAERKTAGS